MSANAWEAGAAGGPAALAPSTHTLSAGESAWLVVLPCALLAALLCLLLGAPLGRALLSPPGDYTLLSMYYGNGWVRPEPVEEGRFLLALTGPLLMVGGILLLTGRRVPAGLPSLARSSSQVVLAAAVVLFMVAQHRHVYDSSYWSGGAPTTVRFFTLPTLVVAAVGAALVALALRRASTVARLARIVRETPAKRISSIVIASLVTLAYLLSAFNTDGTIATVNPAIQQHFLYWIAEPTAILDGRAPLVDFHAQYGHLWAYLTAAAMAVLGPSIGAFSAIMLAGTAGAMAAAYATLRRLVGPSLLTLALFLPFVATSFFVRLGPLENRFSPAGFFSLFPIRYAGPLVLLWLVVRRIDRATTRSPVLLFAFAGLVMINNLEFGLPAFGATVAALLWTEGRIARRSLLRLLASALAGLAVAVALTAVLTLAVAGSLPHFGMVLTFVRIFGSEGFGMLPMPALGLHLAVFATFAAALAVATVRAVEGERELPLTGALAWVGVFGLGTGAYFAGRSHPQVLMDLFSSWSLALVLLAVVAVRAILRRPSRRSSVAELLVLAGVGVAACSLAQVPTPWSQLDRLQEVQPQETRPLPFAAATFRARLEPGEPVAFLMGDAYRIANEAGVSNVAPYANLGAMPAVEEWEETVAALRRAGGRLLVATPGGSLDEMTPWLEQQGFERLPADDRLERIGLVAFSLP